MYNRIMRQLHCDIDGQDNATLGGALKSLRQARKLSQSEVSKRAQISRTVLSRLENDDYNPTVSMIARIVHAISPTTRLTISLADPGEPDPAEIRAAYDMDRQWT